VGRQWNMGTSGPRLPTRGIGRRSWSAKHQELDPNCASATFSFPPRTRYVSRGRTWVRIKSWRRESGGQLPHCGRPPWSPSPSAGEPGVAFPIATHFLPIVPWAVQVAGVMRFTGTAQLPIGFADKRRRLRACGQMGGFHLPPENENRFSDSADSKGRLWPGVKAMDRLGDWTVRPESTRGAHAPPCR
jgi:hypothetical protein